MSKVNKLNQTYSLYPKQFKHNRNLNAKIYWENLNEKYPVDKSLNYCVFINGCFCPPHKGHIHSIKKAIEIFGLNCKIIINQIGSTSRHGVPKEFNKYMMETYISNIFKSNPNIKLLFRASNKEIFLNDFVLKSDVLVVIRGDEINDDDRDDDECVEEINNYYFGKFRKIIKFLNRKFIKVDFILQFRPHTEVSATKFIELLNVYKQKKISGIKSIEDLYELYYMMPEEINLETKYTIIQKLLEFKTYTNFNKQDIIKKDNQTNFINEHANKTSNLIIRNYNYKYDENDNAFLELDSE
jgi:glycerol-3-phosphate cytidylyltransferase-like family protein